jgi:hypothetical protein
MGVFRRNCNTFLRIARIIPCQHEVTRERLFRAFRDVASAPRLSVQRDV